MTQGRTIQAEEEQLREGRTCTWGRSEEVITKAKGGQRQKMRLEAGFLGDTAPEGSQSRDRGSGFQWKTLRGLGLV